MNHKLFTIVVIHYNQLKYYKTALDSVFAQNYPNIELLFADDATDNIDKNEIESYIEENKKENIVNYKVRINQENLGTVKNLNDAIQLSNGEYILFFAADDVLYDENVIRNYVKEFENLSEDKMLVSSQCLMYDHELENEKSKFINPIIALNANEYSSKEQNKMLLNRSCYAVGATAFKKVCFKKWGMFDERYKVVEDWSYFLAFTRKGGTIYYSDFNGLKHREGGISEINIKSQDSLRFKEDILLIYNNEILPYIKILSEPKQCSTLDRYLHLRREYKKEVGKKSILKKSNLKCHRIRLKRKMHSFENLFSTLIKKPFKLCAMSFICYPILYLFKNYILLNNTNFFDILVCKWILDLTLLIFPLAFIFSIIVILILLLLKIISFIMLKHDRYFSTKS